MSDTLRKKENDEIERKDLTADKMVGVGGACLICDIKQDLKDENKPLNIRAKRRTFQAEKPANARAVGLQRAWCVSGLKRGPVRL